MNIRHALTSLVVVSLLAGTAVAGTAGTATNTDQNPAVQSPLSLQQEGDGNGTVSLNRSMYSVQQGETATMNFSLSNLDGMTVQLGGGQADYKLNATVTDGNGDGNVVLLFDTSAAGSGDGSALTTQSDADNLSVKNETEMDSLEPGMYGITVYSGTDENVPKIAYGGVNVQGDETTETTDGNETEDGDSSGETTTTEDGTTEDTESGGQPGFGIGLALTALAGIALLARRR
ncbi:PGF-CTERM protein [Haladaptatus litoreus]|uniref:PGF-CTERM protein n=1 Tax=Haladaptatus litoreus TaxID=553468 RepID=A0A1N6VMM7_9EURY|nr:PGF-CTERM sorting domain-containing protein [Haladaptatus litoreus]SIQ79123.1 PGF-CTERM protein [Haladaptatus litoreus]